MKKIVFILKDGSKIDFDQLTGMEHNKNVPEEEMQMMAILAMELDPQIETYEIVYF
jgi:hypothetical protein